MRLGAGGGVGSPLGRAFSQLQVAGFVVWQRPVVALFNTQRDGVAQTGPLPVSQAVPSTAGGMHVPVVLPPVF
jgi:hypothetical protein